MAFISLLHFPIGHTLETIPTPSYFIDNLSPHDADYHNLTDSDFDICMMTGDFGITGEAQLDLNIASVVATYTTPDWIMYDTGAAAHVCPLNYAEEYPLLPLDWEPPLRSVSGQPLPLYGRRLVGYDFQGTTVHIMYYVTDVNYPICSGMKLSDSQTLAMMEYSRNKHNLDYQMALTCPCNEMVLTYT